MDVAGNEAKLPSSEVFQALLSEALTQSSLQPAFNTSISSNSLDDEEDDALDGIAPGVNINVTKGATSESLPEGGGVAVEIGSEIVDGESPPLPSPSNDGYDAKDEDRVETRGNDPQTAVRLSVLRMLQSNGKFRKAQLRKIQYRHGLYQASLVQATSDSLRATDVLPNYPTAWVRAGDLLSDLWQIGESKQYYEKALSIDESLEESLGPILEDLETRRELLNRARTKIMMPEDTLQLALDVVG